MKLPGMIQAMIAATVEQTIAGVLNRLGVEPKPKPKPQPARPPARELTETEKVVRQFEFLRQHGGIMAEGRYNRDGQMEWRRRP